MKRNWSILISEGYICEQIHKLQLHLLGFFGQCGSIISWRIYEPNSLKRGYKKLLNYFDSSPLFWYVAKKAGRWVMGAGALFIQANDICESVAQIQDGLIERCNRIYN